MIKTVIFDMGGVIITIDHDEAVRRFKELGLTDAEKILDPYMQSGIFGDLEEGKITPDEYHDALEKMVGRRLDFREIQHCWMGYMKDVPQKKLDTIQKLRKEGYRVVLLSNTNPYVTAWTDSDAFSIEWHPIDTYFDAMYRSYEVKYMKPDENFFHYVLSKEQLLPEEALFVDDGPRNCAVASELGINTYCPANGYDWTEEIYEYLK